MVSDSLFTAQTADDVIYWVRQGNDPNECQQGQQRYETLTPMKQACFSGNLEVAQTLFDNGAIIDPFFPIIKVINHYPIIKFLVEHNVSTYGLMCNSIANNDMKMLAFLLTLKPLNLETVDFYHNRSYLMHACEVSNVAAVNMLIAAGANVHVQNQGTSNSNCLTIFGKGNEPEEDRLSIVKMLVRRGVDVNYLNMCGASALMVACAKNQAKVVKFLVKNGANIDEIGCNGVTPLMCSCRNGNVKCAKILIDAGANTKHVDFFGKSVMDVSYIGSNSGIKVLLSLYES